MDGSRQLGPVGLASTLSANSSPAHVRNHRYHAIIKTPPDIMLPQLTMERNHLDTTVLELSTKEARYLR